MIKQRAKFSPTNLGRIVRVFDGLKKKEGYLRFLNSFVPSISVT
jgi:hypothetical protein